MSKKQTSPKQLALVAQFEEDASSIPEQLLTEADAFRATDLLLKVRKMFTEIEEKRKERTAPASETIKLINEDYKKFLKPLEELENSLKKSLEQYATQRIADDLQKLEELRKETGDMSVMIPIGLKNLPSGEGEIRFRKKHDVIVSDFAEVPMEFLTVDVKKLQKVVDAADGDIKIPGITIVPSASVALYAK